MISIVLWRKISLLKKESQAQMTNVLIHITCAPFFNQNPVKCYQKKEAETDSPIYLSGAKVEQASSFRFL